MNIDISAFNQPLKPLPINVAGEEFHLYARFLEIDLPFKPVTNLNLSITDSPLIAFFEGVLLIEIQTTDVERAICGYAIYGKYDDMLILTDLLTNMHHKKFTATFHNWAIILSGIFNLTIPEDLDVVRDVLFAVK